MTPCGSLSHTASRANGVRMDTGNYDGRKAVCFPTDEGAARPVASPPDAAAGRRVGCKQNSRGFKRGPLWQRRIQTGPPGPPKSPPHTPQPPCPGSLAIAETTAAPQRTVSTLFPHHCFWETKRSTSAFRATHSTTETSQVPVTRLCSNKQKLD